MNVELHEASHAALGVLVGRWVEAVEVDRGAHWPGERMGAAVIPLDHQRIEPHQIGLALIGYLAEKRPDWPPPWPAALTERRERLGLVLRTLGVDKSAYEAAVELTRKILADPDFQLLQSSISRALRHVPRLEAADIAALCEANGFPVPAQPEERTTCST